MLPAGFGNACSSVRGGPRSRTSLQPVYGGSGVHFGCYCHLLCFAGMGLCHLALNHLRDRSKHWGQQFLKQPTNALLSPDWTIHGWRESDQAGQTVDVFKAYLIRKFRATIYYGPTVGRTVGMDTDNFRRSHRTNGIAFIMGPIGIVRTICPEGIQ